MPGLRLPAYIPHCTRAAALSGPRNSANLAERSEFIGRQTTFIRTAGSHTRISAARKTPVSAFAHIAARARPFRTLLFVEHGRCVTLGAAQLRADIVNRQCLDIV